ncbi:MAG: kynureninase [Bdellovibrio sp.]
MIPAGVSAQQLDQEYPSLREEFVFPHPNGIYFAGHSLGLMPKGARQAINAELDSWGTFAVEGHFKGPHPWLPYHERVTESLAKLVGARPSEVVAMNSLTVNLHLMMVSFYKVRGLKRKVLIEQNAFPSDQYAVDSQVRFHGGDPRQDVLELPDSVAARGDDSILEFMDQHRDTLALVMLGNCNYLTGQKFDFEKITRFCRAQDIRVGFNLAHGAGNLALRLHDWRVDFAVWCSYKYLNSGPGGIAGCFVHEDHHREVLPRFEGWWGQDKSSRFLMERQFHPILSVEAWQLSNPPIFQLAALRASLDLFDRVGMSKLRASGDRLTDFFSREIETRLSGKVNLVTPAQRGSMLCLRFCKSPRELVKKLHQLNVHVDFREPDIVRATPAPLYNSFQDVRRFVDLLEEELS